MDTENYIHYYDSLTIIDDGLRFEPVFHYTAVIFSWAGLTYHWFFSFLFVVFVVVCGVAYRSIGEVVGAKTSLSQMLAFFGFLLASSWFVVATTNGLRQGLAAPLVWLALISYVSRRYFTSIIMCLVAVGIHRTAVIVFPFFVFFHIGRRSLLGIMVGIGAGYIFGINEMIVSRLSAFGERFLHFNIHDEVKGYAEGSDNWVGFQWNLFVYTLGWVIFYFLVKRVQVNSARLILVWRIYCVLVAPYFVMGFGAYSNRYALYGWLFLPVMHSVFLMGMKMNSVLKIYFVGIVFLFGLVSYTMRLIGLV